MVCACLHGKDHMHTSWDGRERPFSEKRSSGSCGGAAAGSGLELG